MGLAARSEPIVISKYRQVPTKFTSSAVYPELTPLYRPLKCFPQQAGVPNLSDKLPLSRATKVKLSEDI